MTRRTVLTMGLVSTLLAACGRGGRDDPLGIYVAGRYAGGQLSTADVGAPLNPGSVGLW